MGYNKDSLVDAVFRTFNEAQIESLLVELQNGSELALRRMSTQYYLDTATVVTESNP